MDRELCPRYLPHRTCLNFVADRERSCAVPTETVGAHEMASLSRLSTPAQKSLHKATVDWAKYRLTEEATVVLHRANLSASLGVTLAKYPHDVPHPRIYELVKDGIAEQSGMLRPKDAMVAVNGVSVDSDAAAAQVIGSSGLQITFTIRRAPSPLNALPMHTPVQKGKSRLTTDASREVTADHPWAEPEQPAYPLQKALASPPESPALFASSRNRSNAKGGDARSQIPNNPLDSRRISGIPEVMAGSPHLRAPLGPPPGDALVGSPDGEKAGRSSGRDSPHSDGTETSAESQAEAGLHGKALAAASTEQIKDDFWGECHPLTASCARTVIRAPV